MEAGPRRGGRFSGVALLVLALLLTLGCGCSGESESARAGGAPVSSGEMAPDFTLELLEGGSVSLSDLRGKVVVIDFWATWCPPCEYQVPELNAFYEAHRASGRVEVLGISVDTEGPDAVGLWTSDKQVRYPILMGDEALARRFGAVGFPTLIIVAPDGSIDSRHVGLIERQELEDALARQLNGDSAAT